MVCRDVTRGEEARQEIITQTGNQASSHCEPDTLVLVSLRSPIVTLIT